MENDVQEISIFAINSPYTTSHLIDHEKVKDSVLDIINSMGSDKDPYNFNTDWTLDRSISRDYWKYIERPIMNYVNAAAQALGYNESKIKNYWFQQYTKGSDHPWHIHLDCQWTNVYYLEFPEGSPATELIEPLTGRSISVDVKEGSLLTFPSYVWHRAPTVDSDVRKTIISFNSDFC